MNFTTNNGAGTNEKAGLWYVDACRVAQESADEHNEVWYVFGILGEGEPFYPRGTKFAVIHEAGGEGKVVSRHKYQRTAETACQRRNRLANARVYAIKVVYP